MRAAAGGDALIATAVADALAATGMPFREAHDQVSRNLANLSPLAASHGVTVHLYFKGGKSRAQLNKEKQEEEERRQTDGSWSPWP